MTTWVQYELAQHCATTASFGTLRMVRDAFQKARKIEFDYKGNILSIRLNQMHKLARNFQDYWPSHFAQSEMSCILGEI
jgi:hypothetical protein